uniref:ABC2_membrane domain-containing protein n=1 Tax=Haemonchus contortus TaxID=6289 RepID=A0A7I4YNX2_HAECO
MEKCDPIPPTYKPRRFHWYIRPKDRDILDEEKMRPSTSQDLSDQSLSRSNRSDSTADYRFCHGGVSAKYLSNMIIIALIQEISVGLILATADPEWFREPRFIILTACRIVQLVPCFLALAGNYTNNATLLVPFMLSQISLGSYADLTTYMLLVQNFQANHPDFWLFANPLLYVVLPILLYACLLMFCIYVTNKSIKFVNLKRLGAINKNAADTQVESLM